MCIHFKIVLHITSYERLAPCDTHPQKNFSKPLNQLSSSPDFSNVHSEVCGKVK